MNLYEYHTQPETLKWFEDRRRRVPYLAYLYARDIIKGRWPDGEDAIKTDPWAAYFYARDIIKGPWPDGEESIKANPIRYIFNLIKKLKLRK